jgi:hypothetical protein
VVRRGAAWCGVVQRSASARACHLESVASTLSEERRGAPLFSQKRPHKATSAVCVVHSAVTCVRRVFCALRCAKILITVYTEYSALRDAGECLREPARYRLPVGGRCSRYSRTTPVPAREPYAGGGPAASHTSSGHAGVCVQCITCMLCYVMLCVRGAPILYLLFLSV